MPWPGGTVLAHHIASLGVVISNLKLSPHLPLCVATQTKARAEDSLGLQAGMSRRRVQRGTKRGCFPGTALASTKGKAVKLPTSTKQAVEKLQGHGATIGVFLQHSYSLLPSTPQSCHSKPLWTQPLNGSGWKEKRTGKEKENPWEGRVTGIVMLFKAKAGKQQGQVLLRHRGGKEREVGETQSLRGCQSPCFADRVCSINHPLNYPNLASQFKIKC